MNDFYVRHSLARPTGHWHCPGRGQRRLCSADALGYLADKDDMTKLDFISDFPNKDFSAMQGWLDRCRFVVLGDPGNPEDDPNTPYTAMLDRTLATVRGRADFQLVATCPSLGGKNYYVYQHLPTRS